jgi:hypothetical protein
MKKTEISSYGRDIMDSTNNGTLSMLTNGREIQERENSTKTSVFTLRETSTSNPE